MKRPLSIFLAGAFALLVASSAAAFAKVSLQDCATGTLLEASDYLVWGERSDKAVGGSMPEGLTLRDHFSGKEDQGVEFGLPYLNFGARFYVPDLKRWLTIDPLSEKYYGVSPYAYCADNPVNLVDPDGKDWYMADDNTIKWTEHTSQTKLDKSKVNGRYLGAIVVVFDGYYDETLGYDNDRQRIGNIYGEGAKTANVTVYGLLNAEDISMYIGFTMSSDFEKFGAIVDGEYDVSWTEPHRKLDLQYQIYHNGSDVIDCINNINPYSGINRYSDTQKNEIFVHRSNYDGWAGVSPDGKSGVSVGCLLIGGKDWYNFHKKIGNNDFKLFLNRK